MKNIFHDSFFPPIYHHRNKRGEMIWMEWIRKMKHDISIAFSFHSAQMKMFSSESLKKFTNTTKLKSFLEWKALWEKSSQKQLKKSSVNKTSCRFVYDVRRIIMLVNILSMFIYSHFLLSVNTNFSYILLTSERETMKIFNVEHHEKHRVKGKEEKFPFHNTEKRE